MNNMRSFAEFEAIFYNENEILGKKTKDNAKIKIDMYSVVAWNENDNDTVTVELFGAGRYGLNISYENFSQIMSAVYYKLSKELVQPQP